jgi:hypothetical protein
MGMAMYMGVRIVILLCCAYAGWQTGSVQFGRLQDHEQLIQTASPQFRMLKIEIYDASSLAWLLGPHRKAGD